VSNLEYAECVTPGAALRGALGGAAQLLARAGIGTARLDAEVLLSHSLAMPRERLLIELDTRLGSAQAKRFAALLARRLDREPIAYIVGRQEFWSLDLAVSPEVLIPRPETERMVEAGLTLAAQAAPGTPLRILDLGTGSGAVAIALAKELASAQLYASDSSRPALAIARRNAALNGVIERISFCHGDLFEALDDRAAPFDLIVANPPYIQTAEIDGLAPEVSRWEPRIALDGGADGLDFYRRIAAQSRRFLATGGALVVEIGAGSAAEVLAIFGQAGFCRDIGVLHDYAGRERVVTVRDLENCRHAN